MAVFPAKFDDVETSSPVTSIVSRIRSFLDPEGNPTNMIEYFAEAVHTVLAYEVRITEPSDADTPSALSPRPCKHILESRARRKAYKLLSQVLTTIERGFGREHVDTIS